MSWIVKHLILNKHRYDKKDSYYISKHEDGLSGIENDIEEVYEGSEYFDDLLAISSKIEELYKENRLSNIDLRLIEMLSNGYSYREIQDSLGINKDTISGRFDRICNMIAFSLGEHFTDEGYLEYIMNKYKLNIEQANKVLAFMEGGQRHESR